MNDYLKRLMIWGEQHPIRAAVSFVLLLTIVWLVLVAITSDESAAEARFPGCHEGEIEDKIESALFRTDLGKARLKARWCDYGNLIDPKRGRARLEITGAGEVAQWEGEITRNVLRCVKGGTARGWCKVAAWRATYRFEQHLGPVTNTDTIKLRIRCNHKKHCSTGSS